MMAVQTMRKKTSPSGSRDICTDRIVMPSVSLMFRMSNNMKEKNLVLKNPCREKAMRITLFLKKGLVTTTS